MGTPVTIRRVDHNTFEISEPGKEPVYFKRGDCVAGDFGCFGIIDHFYGAVRGAYAFCLKRAES